MLAAALVLGSAAWASADPRAVPLALALAGSAPPPGSTEPITSGAIDSTAWVRADAETLLVPPAGEAPAVAAPAAEAPPAEAASGPSALGQPRSNVARVLGETHSPRKARAAVAAGAYGGYPTWGGAMIVAPADGSVAFRSGITGLPGIGIVWTPGFEVRFGQERGTFAADGALYYGNLLLGRSYLNGRRDYTGLETGVGYRWILTDRRGLRWIAACEIGGYWRSESAWPLRPSLRAYWLLVE